MNCLFYIMFFKGFFKIYLHVGNLDGFEILQKERMKFKSNVLETICIINNLDNSMSNNNGILGMTYAQLLDNLK